MAGILAELGKKLAERWLTLLVLPGALYLSAIAAVSTLSHRAPFAFADLLTQIESWAQTARAEGPTALGVVLAALILGSAAAGLAAQALGSLIERVWLAADWPSWPLLHRLAHSRVNARQKRWNAADAEEKDRRRKMEKHLGTRSGTGQDSDDELFALRQALNEAYHARRRIAHEPPARPTWIGDRVNTVTIRFSRAYHIDLALAWPSLWLTMPQTTRSEIVTCRQSLTRATALAGWALLYGPLALLWWPMLPLAATVAVTAWLRARAATESYALLIEAAAQLHIGDLARTLGLECTGPMTSQVGRRLTDHLRGRPPTPGAGGGGGGDGRA